MASCAQDRLITGVITDRDTKDTRRAGNDSVTEDRQYPMCRVLEQ